MRQSFLTRNELPTSTSHKSRLLQRSRNQAGQGLIEYLIIVALVAVATIGVVRVLGQAVTSRFNTISYALQGKKKVTPVINLEEQQLRKKDLGDFMNGVSQKDGGD